MKYEDLSCYKADHEQDFKGKEDSLITMYSYGNHFSNQAVQQGQNDHEIETALTSSHQKTTILGTGVLIPRHCSEL